MAVDKIQQGLIIKFVQQISNLKLTQPGKNNKQFHKKTVVLEK